MSDSKENNDKNTPHIFKYICVYGGSSEGKDPIYMKVLKNSICF